MAIPIKLGESSLNATKAKQTGRGLPRHCVRKRVLSATARRAALSARCEALARNDMRFRQVRT